LETLEQGQHQYQRVDHPAGIHQLQERVSQKAHQEQEQIPLKRMVAEEVDQTQLGRVLVVMAGPAGAAAGMMALVPQVMEIHLLHLHHKEIVVEQVVMRRGILGVLVAAVLEVLVQAVLDR
jgi:NADPH-dependent glutamate synthase beta subunit-like oxidoreductase